MALNEEKQEAPRDERLLSAEELAAVQSTVDRRKAGYSLSFEDWEALQRLIPLWPTGLEEALLRHIDALTEQLAAAEGRAVWSREVPTVEGEWLHLNHSDSVAPEVLLLEWIDLDGDGQQLAADDWGESAEGIGGWWMPFTRPARASGEEG